MERGHQERLAPMARDVVGRAGVSFAELRRIVVVVGPGSFTGLRVGVAFAKGVRMATGAALAGVGALPALATAAGSGLVAAALDARQGLVHLQLFEAGQALGPPQTLAVEEAAQMLAPMGRITLTGVGARLLSSQLSDAEVFDQEAPSLGVLARLGARTPDAADLRPLYLRAPDIRMKSGPRGA